MHDQRYTFRESLACASTLPSSYYLDPAALTAEYERVFGRSWQLAANATQLDAAGDYVTTVVGDEPVLIVRGNDGQLRAMSNVCRHRAGPVAAGCGRRKVLQCRYHGWTYGLDGQLLTTP